MGSTILPWDMIIEILKSVDIFSLVRMTGVCKKWRDYIYKTLGYDENYHVNYSHKGNLSDISLRLGYKGFGSTQLHIDFNTYAWDMRALYDLANLPLDTHMYFDVSQQYKTDLRIAMDGFLMHLIIKNERGEMFSYKIPRSRRWHIAKIMYILMTQSQRYLFGLGSKPEGGSSWHELFR